jgi:hypothetical protein
MMISARTTVDSREGSIEVVDLPPNLRRGGMHRKLSKLEQEIGLCDVKMERELRLRKKLQLLREDLEALDQVIAACSAPTPAAPVRKGRRTGGKDRPMMSFRGFLATGFADSFQEEREILDRERENLLGKLGTLTGFDGKRTVLEQEKRKHLMNLSPAHSSSLQRRDKDFKAIEKQWNSATEDLLNLDGGIYFLDRNIDYLKSCRKLFASGEAREEAAACKSGDFLLVLFRHTAVGQAKEMAEGADLNLKLAQMDLVCVSSTTVRADLFRTALLPLSRALYEDLSGESGFRRSVQALEAILAANLELTEKVKGIRAALATTIEDLEKIRGRLSDFVRGRRA